MGGRNASGPGGVVVVAGPDGCGKSSLADVLERELLPAPSLRIHHRPGVLPSRTAHLGPVTQPHRDPPYPPWLSALKVSYLFLDYLAGWRLRVRPVVRRGGWVVLERGWWDLAVDARRYRLGGVAPLVRLLGRLLPRPTVTLVLRAPLELLLARSGDDIQPREVARQRVVFDQLYAGLPGTAFLDASQPAAHVAGDAAVAMSARGARFR